MKTVTVDIDGWLITLTKEDHPERFMAESWYTAITQGLFSGQAEQPERAIKKAFQKLAVHHYGYPSRYCAICEDRMGDDIECYEQECDETIRQLIPAVEEWS